MGWQMRRHVRQYQDRVTKRFRERYGYPEDLEPRDQHVENVPPGMPKGMVPPVELPIVLPPVFVQQPIVPARHIVPAQRVAPSLVPPHLVQPHVVPPQIPPQPQAPIPDRVRLEELQQTPQIDQALGVAPKGRPKPDLRRHLNRIRRRRVSPRSRYTVGRASPRLETIPEESQPEEDEDVRVEPVESIDPTRLPVEVPRDLPEDEVVHHVELLPERVRDLARSLQSYCSNILPGLAIPRRQDHVTDYGMSSLNTASVAEIFGCYSVHRITEISCGCAKVIWSKDGQMQQARVPPFPHRPGCPNVLEGLAEPYPVNTRVEPDIRKSLRIDPTTPAAQRREAIIRAAKAVTLPLESVVPFPEPVAKPVCNTVPQTRWNLCFKCHRKGHVAAECQVENAPKFCHVCGHVGYLAYECPVYWIDHSRHEDRRNLPQVPDQQPN